MSKQILHVDETGEEKVVYRTPSRAQGRICLGAQRTFQHHRCGWGYALDALLPAHNDQGVLLDGFLDITFNSMHRPDWEEPIPYRRPWTAFCHNPPQMPDWFPKAPTLQRILTSRNFQESLPYCQGLFTLSEYLAEYLRKELGVKVSALIFPTEIPRSQFDYSAFLRNRNKKVVMVGWWLRRQTSLDYLPLDKLSGYCKWRLISSNPAMQSTIRVLSRLEYVRESGARARLEPRHRENTETVLALSNEDYDRLLSENVLFLDLYDASANNAVVECIARATPLLINRLPAVIEYLGEDYPLYFESLEEAAEKALDFDLIHRAHEYLLTCSTREKLSQDSFLKSFCASEVYQGLRIGSVE